MNLSKKQQQENNRLIRRKEVQDKTGLGASSIYALLEHDTGKTSKTVRIPSKKNAVKVYAVKEGIFSWEA